MAVGKNQLRGALLEEAILYLLRRSGYKLVTNAGTDSTLRSGSSGLELRGRGAWHQIDAISDFRVTPPFTNPQRLLVEGKCLSSRVGLPIARNGLGVLKDVSENWLLTGNAGPTIPMRRHHYLYAIFSATDFTKPAQDYAFAHDLPLLALRNSAFFRPVIDAIDGISPGDIDRPIALKDIRGFVRFRLLGAGNRLDDADMEHLEVCLESYLNACEALSLGFITMFGGQFPAFLVAEDVRFLEQAIGPIKVRIRWKNESWFIEDSMTGQEFFSFDLPKELFTLYAERGELSQRNVANLKSDMMREFFAFISVEERIRLVTFRLDESWLNALRRQRNV